MSITLNDGKDILEPSLIGQASHMSAKDSANHQGLLSAPDEEIWRGHRWSSMGPHVHILGLYKCKPTNELEATSNSEFRQEFRQEHPELSYLDTYGCQTKPCSLPPRSLLSTRNCTTSGHDNGPTVVGLDPANDIADL